MTDRDEQNNSKYQKEGEGAEDSYRFIKETRKEKPEDRRRLVKRLLITAGTAAGAGLIAAAVFAASVPVFSNLFGNSGSQEEKVEISVSSSSAESETAEGETGAAEGQTAETAAETEESAAETEEETAESAVADYKTVYQGMADVAESVECSMVEVIGITSSLDYFNHDYENRQSLSGLLVAESGTTLYCLAESRNLKKAESIQIIFCDGKRVSAEFLASDSETDLAVLAISRSDIEDDTWNAISIATFGNYSSLKQGTPVIALGSIFGTGDSMEYGFVTSVNTTVSFWDVNYNVITTDMAGSSSGSGCLLNLDGEVVGFIDQNVSSEDQNLVTAIPMKQLSSMMEDLINDVPQIRIGIKGQTVDSEISESSGIPQGVLVSDVDQESPAMYAGIKALDVITAIDGETVSSYQDYRRIIASLAEGVEVQVEAMRMGKETYEEISFQLKPETK